jgi:orotate phosphoribosyltransferase
MLYNTDVARQIADFLLEIKAVLLRPSEPFTWASGWRSPIYCDNRMILGYPHIRTFLKTKWAEAAKDLFPGAQAVAGVATAGIAHAALIADTLNLPMAYVRPKPKDHGTGKLIEGKLDKGQKAVVIEDLISTGKSSMQAVQALLDEGIVVEGIMGIFSYGFAEAEDLFKSKKFHLYTLCNYDILLEQAQKRGYVKKEQLPTLQEWRKNPGEWMQEKV